MTDSVDVSIELKGQQYVFKCDAFLVDDARKIVASILELSRPSKSNSITEPVPWQWGVFKFKNLHDGRVEVLSQDYSRNPLVDWSPDLTITVNVISLQNEFFSGLGFAFGGVYPTLFSDKVIYRNSSLQQSEVCMQRQATCSRDSGWYIGPITDIPSKADELTALYAFELLEVRSQLVKYLTLPVGYMVVLQGSEVLEILDETNTNILQFKGRGMMS